MSARRTTGRRQLIVQIDGLSRPALERALEHDGAPRLARLIGGAGATLHSVYSGLPSTTPAVQGEFFYGVRAAVPAFAFLHERRSSRHMMDPSAADDVQRRIEQNGAWLLESGACYCDIYTGGAAHARFCPVGVARSTTGLPRGLAFRLRSLGAYAGVCVRAAGMMIGEGARLVTRRAPGGLRARLKRSWDRILFSVVLRDSARLAAIDDIRSGVPVVHINFLGYDVQSHAYGPDSAPARRALKGIDKAIASLLREFRRAEGPDASWVVYSDHGQEATTPLVRSLGAPIEDIVLGACSEEPAATEPDETPAPGAPRVSTLAPSFAERLLGVGTTARTDAHGRSVTTVESGPIAHVYLDPRFGASARARIGARISARTGRIAALWIDEHGQAGGCVGERPAPLPLERFCVERLVRHPFRDLIAPDLDRLLRHPDAGDLVLLGSGFTDDAVTFAPERGSHAGPGPFETHAFAIVPDRLGLGRSEGTLRFRDLREALLADREA